MKSRNLSRILALVLMLALVFSLAACSSSAPAAEAPAAEAPAAEAPAAEAPTTAFPEKPINFYVAAGAGGAMDVSLRVLIPYLEDELGVDVAINNISGAGGWVCYADVLNKPADGYTITSYANSNFFGLYNPTSQIEGDINDWEFLANAVTDANALYTNKDSEVQTLEQFIDYVTNNTDVLIGTTSIGFDDHTAYVKLASAIPGMLENTTALPASNVTEVVTNQLGGFQDFMVANVGDYNTVKDNLNIICIFAEERSPLVPNVPTFNELAAELGLDADVTASTHRGYLIRSGVDAEVKEVLVNAFEKAMANPEYLAELNELFFVPNCLVGDDAQQMIMDDLKAFESIVPLLVEEQQADND